MRGGSGPLPEEVFPVITRVSFALEMTSSDGIEDIRMTMGIFRDFTFMVEYFVRKRLAMEVRGKSISKKNLHETLLLAIPIHQAGLTCVLFD